MRYWPQWPHGPPYLRPVPTHSPPIPQPLLRRASCLLPPPLQDYAIDVSTAEKPPDQYDTLQAFFARRLKPELRPIAEPE